MADPGELIKAVSGAIAVFAAASITALVSWLVPKYAKKTEIESRDKALIIDADVKRSDIDLRERANLFDAFNKHISQLHERIDQLVKELNDSIRDRDNLWQELRKEQMHSRDQDAALLLCERKSVEYEATASLQKTTIEKQQSSILELKQSIDDLNTRLNEYESYAESLEAEIRKRKQETSSNS